MGIRSTVASFIGGDQVEGRLRDLVEGILAAKSFARPADLQELREQISGLGAGFGGKDLVKRIEALEADNASLRKKVDMLRGAVEAATGQISEAKGEARKAIARAESALATVESLATGVEALESASGKPAKKTKAKTSVSLNGASAEDLEALPGVGPSMAQRIVEEREKNGRFHKVSDLSRVKGLGAAAVKRLEGLLSV
jgi:competence ComEA-like helix-hairpin-helix protein